jgi:hypothetical protein
MKNLGEVDLRDVFKQNVEAGEPLVLNGMACGPLSRMVDAMAEELAAETGRKVHIIQIVDVGQSATKLAETLGGVDADICTGGARIDPIDPDREE